MYFSKKLKAVLFFYACAFALAHAQNAASNLPAEALQGSPESEIVISGQPESSSSLEAALPIKSEQEARRSQSYSTFSVFIRMILVLVFVVALMYVIVRFMRNGLRRPENKDPFLRLVSSVSLSPGKSVQVFTLLDHAYIVGVSDSSVNLIDKIDDKDLVDSMNLYADKNENSSRPKNFNDILALFMPNSAENKNVFKKSAQTAADLLKKQRERLNGGGGEL
ncbi:flagellar biosynthetic protein FliO [Treponema parvum]|uniref:Flagellar biosynthetic protein FliO n=1 Tax=Treponema parvum TaxID=138851 RepID=A0A975EZE0_9SPIR|nr:flagellar biosynthetic protein FliO [Treponema parvum]QTQ11741.1 flagellar biosynthetic protein FliO [Treponema parvum]